MKRDELRKIFDGDGGVDSWIDVILDKWHEEIEPLKKELSSAQAQRDEYKSELDEANSAIANLEKSTKENEQARNEIAEYKKQIEELSEARRADKIASEIEKAVIKARGRNLKTIKPLLDMDKIELDKDGAITGLDEQLKLIAKTDSYLFESPEADSSANPTPETMAGETAGHEPRKSGAPKKSDIGRQMAEKFMTRSKIRMD